MASNPAVFIASSAEGRDIASAISYHLRYDARPTPWTGIFTPSNTTFEDLEQRIAQVDFGIVVLSPDDQTKMRNESNYTPRDNVLLELGMLFGAIGRRRTFFVLPFSGDMHLPTDLLGVNPVKYDAEWVKEPGKAQEALAAMAGEILTEIKRQGPIKRANAEDEGAPADDAATEPPQGAFSASPVPNGLVPGPGGPNDGWRYFVEQGWLTPIPVPALPSTRWVVHRRYGLGEIIGHGPTGGSEVEVTARFATGIARLAVPPEILFDPKHN